MLMVFSLSLTVVSCSDDDDDKVNNSIVGTWEFKNDNSLNVEFAKGLAFAMQDNDIRSFIKEEALKEVDKDFDVIYALVKEHKLKNGKTFREILSEYMGGLEKLDSIASIDPTLTILVPYLGEFFNAENWDIEKQIPSVAYREELIDKKKDNILSYDFEGNQFYISRYEMPKIPIVVVKSNERLVNPNRKNINITKSITDANNSCLINDNGEIVGHFIDNEFINNDNRLKGTTVRDGVNSVIDHSTDIHFGAHFYNNESPRDYLYYGISPIKGINKGILNTSIKEFITSIQFNTAANLSHVADYDDNSKGADWSDGNLEIVFDFLFLTKDEILSKVTKMASISINELFTSNGTLQYSFPNPIEVFNWDMYKYGSTFKIIVSEYDPGTQIEKNESTSTTISHNWEVGASGGFGPIWKVNSKYGGSLTEVKQKSTKINFTNNSDPLGEILVDFFNPIFSNKNVILNVFSYKRGSILFIPPKKVIHEEKTFTFDQYKEVQNWIQSVKVKASNGFYSTETITIGIPTTGLSLYRSNTGMVSLMIQPMKVNK